MLDKILKFIREAGTLTLDNQNNLSKINQKTASISNVVTEIDYEVSHRFAKFAREEFANLDYIIVDEESIEKLGLDPLEEISKHEYVFVIDPIDGTLTYANGLPFFGIMVGVFRKSKPLVGAVVCPALDLLICADENSAFVEKNGKLKPLERLSNSAPLYANQTYLDEDWLWHDEMGVSRLVCYSAAVNLMYLATGKLRCLATQFCLWDIAGAYPILEKVGIKVYSSGTLSEISLFDSNFINNELRFRKPIVLCLPKYHADFRRLYRLS